MENHRHVQNLETAARRMKRKNEEFRESAVLKDVIERKSAEQFLTLCSDIDAQENQIVMLETAVQNLRTETASFSELLYVTMSAKDPEGGSSFVHEFLPQVCFQRRVHEKYAWEYWISSHLFHGFENAFFGLPHLDMFNAVSNPERYRADCFLAFQEMSTKSSSTDEMAQTLLQCSRFREFCRTKFLQVIPSCLEHVLFGNFYHSCAIIAHGKFPSNVHHIFHRFLVVAKAVWILHKLAWSFEPPARIIWATPAMHYDGAIMESVMASEDLEKTYDLGKVAFVIAPGFCVRNTIVRKSQVYLISEIANVKFSGDVEESQMLAASSIHAMAQVSTIQRVTTWCMQCTDDRQFPFREIISLVRFPWIKLCCIVSVSRCNHELPILSFEKSTWSCSSTTLSRSTWTMSFLHRLGSYFLVRFLWLKKLQVVSLCKQQLQLFSGKSTWGCLSTHSLQVIGQIFFLHGMERCIGSRSAIFCFVFLELKAALQALELQLLFEKNYTWSCLSKLCLIERG